MSQKRLQNDVKYVESISRPMKNTVCVRKSRDNISGREVGLCGSTAGTTASYKQNNTDFGICRIVSDLPDNKNLCSECKKLVE